MVVNRRTFLVNKPYFDEAQALLGDLRDMVHAVHPESVMRIYASAYGTFDTVAAEVVPNTLHRFNRRRSHGIRNAHFDPGHAG